MSGPVWKLSVKPRCGPNNRTKSTWKGWSQSAFNRTVECFGCGVKANKITTALYDSWYVILASMHFSITIFPFLKSKAVKLLCLFGARVLFQFVSIKKWIISRESLLYLFFVQSLTFIITHNSLTIVIILIISYLFRHELLLIPKYLNMSIRII